MNFDTRISSIGDIIEIVNGYIFKVNYFWVKSLKVIFFPAFYYSFIFFYFWYFYNDKEIKNSNRTFRFESRYLYFYYR